MAIIERPKRIYRKRIPYGMQNFEDVIKEDCYYVDKTPLPWCGDGGMQRGIVK